MNFEAHGTMRSSPGVALENHVSPLHCSGRVHGQVSAEVGAISIHLSQIPVTFRIPFLRRSSPIVVGTIGPAELKVDPFTLSLQEFSLGAEATLGGKEGFTIVTEGKVACATEMSVEGAATGDIGLGALHFGKPPERPRTVEKPAFRKKAAE